MALKELREAVETAISAETDPNKRIRAAMRTHLRISTDYQDFGIVLLREVRHLSEEAQARVIAKRDDYEAIWKQLFRDARDAGHYKADVDIRLLRLLTFGAINLVVTWYRESGAYSPEQIADALFKIAGDGVLVEGAELVPDMLSVNSEQ